MVRILTIGICKRRCDKLMTE